METQVPSWSSTVMAKLISWLRFGQDSKGANYPGPTVRRRLHAKKGEPKLRWHCNRPLSDRNSVVLSRRVFVLGLGQKWQTAEKRQQLQQWEAGSHDFGFPLASDRWLEDDLRLRQIPGVTSDKRISRHLSEPMFPAGRTVFEPYSGNPTFFSRSAQRGSEWRESKPGNRMTASSSSSCSE